MAHVPASQNAQPGGRAGDGEASHPDSRQILALGHVLALQHDDEG